MNLILKSGLPNNLPYELMISAKSLEHLGILEMAWGWQDAISVIEFFCKNGMRYWEEMYINLKMVNCILLMTVGILIRMRPN